MAKSSNDTVNRRDFLKGAAGTATGAALLTTAVPAAEMPASVPAPTPQQLARDAGDLQPSGSVRAVTRPGSDLMVQVLRDLGVEYVASNPGSSFEGLQESIINYGDPPNAMPEFITALHEESAVDMAHGYGKAQGRPMCALLHGTIGLQHAAMAIYQAYNSGTPVLLLAGRDHGFIQAHTADDMAGMVRSYTKWDAQPVTLAESLAAIQRAYAEAITPPTAPVLVVLDIELQKQEAGDLVQPAVRTASIGGVDRTAAGVIAAGLVNAANPQIAVGRLRTPAGVALAVELAELVGACVETRAMAGPMSFPQRHPLCGPGSSDAYDYTLGLEVAAAQVSIRGPAVATLTATRDPAGIGFGSLRNGAVPGSTAAVNLPVDAEASLPDIIDEVRRLLTTSRRSAIAQRAAQHAHANQQARMAALQLALQDKRIGWDASPVSTARIYSELWPLIVDLDWCLASPSAFSGSHHVALWDHNRPWSYLGGQGAGGMGYGIGACVGAALAAKNRGRIVINIQTDGDLNYAPGALWTAAHHRLPLLTIMHNNRAWHQELMFLQYMTGVRGRGTDRAHIGTTLRDPEINYVKMAEGYGMAAEGPIADPRQLAAALQRGVDAVRRGEPYLIDVITQPR